MKIEGERRAFGQLAEPSLINVRADRSSKVRRGRIAGVARHAPIIARDKLRFARSGHYRHGSSTSPRPCPRQYGRGPIRPLDGRESVRQVVAHCVERPVAAAGATGDKGAMQDKDRADMAFTLDELARTIDERAGSSAEASYTRSLLDKGPAHCARKFGEEAIELAIAAAALDESAVRAEAADVLYHLLVVLRARGVALSSVMNELDSRSGRSGLEEKASRAK
jgi:phosphoribosyl-ATP pyrophosphohydrolase